MALSSPMSANAFRGDPKIFLKAKSTVGLTPSGMVYRDCVSGCVNTRVHITAPRFSCGRVPRARGILLEIVVAMATSAGLDRP